LRKKRGEHPSLSSPRRPCEISRGREYEFAGIVRCEGARAATLRSGPGGIVAIVLESVERAVAAAGARSAKSAVEAVDDEERAIVVMALFFWRSG
jgi:hypothetical protein